MAGALFLCVLALLALALVAAFRARAPGTGTVIYSGTMLVSGAGAIIAAMALWGEVSALWLPVGLPWQGVHLRLDALSAFFAFVVNLGAAGASLYAIGYGRHEHEPQRVLPFFPAFLAGMNLVLLADDAYGFLFAWETMSLASWALVVSHHRQAENLRAGYVYILMASFGTLALLLCFGLLAGAGGGYTFEAMREAPPTEGIAALVLLLAILGAGSKAGLMPLHAWLPLAHPAAPSHVSALMSGVMTKVAVYGFVRIVFDLNADPAWWWGLPLLVLGGVSAAMGVLHALMESDIKRMLACSTIENIGVIFLMLGLALAFMGNGMDAAAALAFTAALFHALNHMLFKSVLFFGAGTVLVAAGTRAMDKLGGLIHRMPVSSAAFLVAAMAASALPPLNGFVSEWMAFQAILLSPSLPQWALKFAIPAMGTLLALAAALGAACFVRAFGITYLGRPRSAEAAGAVETDAFSRAAMVGFAALCVLVGLFPGAVIDAVAPCVELLIGGRMPAQLGLPWLSIVPIGESRSSYNGLLVLLFMVGSGAMTMAAVHRFASRAVRKGPAWDCGFVEPSPMTQYTSETLSQPIRRVFGTVVFRARDTVDMPVPGEERPARITRERHDLVWDYAYAPIGRFVAWMADKLNALQFLTIRRYLSLVFALLVLLLLGLALWR